MSDSRPFPLTPADCDLRNFAHMQLDVARLRDSRFASHSTGDGFRAGVLLWSASWHQVPAASVPNDLIELSQLAGYGRVTAEFEKVRVEALHGFLLCTDGRWYHAVVAEKALAAWDEKLRWAYGKLADRLRKENKKRAEEGLEPHVIPTLDQWKAAEFPLTFQFDLRSRQPESFNLPLSSLGFPAEKKDVPAEELGVSGGTLSEFQRKTLLKGEGEGEGLINTPLPPKGGERAKPIKREFPVCPYAELVGLYHAALPELPAAKLMSDKRKRALRGFWEWVFSSTKSDGTKRAETVEDALAWIKAYFERVRLNDFLMGIGGRSSGHENWQCDLDFLLTEKGKKHVIEKTREPA